MSAYRKKFDGTKYMPFLIKNDKLLGKYNEIWEKVSKSREKEFDSEPIYNEKCLKTKIKSYKAKINTSFHNNKILKEGSQCTCLSLISIDSVSRTGNTYYTQVFSEKCKYIVKKKGCLSILLTTFFWFW